MTGQSNKLWRILALVAGALVVAVLAFALLVNGRVLPQTSIGTLGLGGKNAEEARAELLEKITTFATQPVMLVLDGQTVTTTLADLGLSVDLAETLKTLDERVFTWETGDPFTAAGDATIPTTLPATVVVDDVKLSAALDQFLAGTYTAPVDAQLITTQGVANIQPEQAGRGIDRVEARTALLEQVRRLSNEPLTLTSEPLAPAISAADLASAQQQAQAILQEQLMLITGKTQHEILPTELGSWLGHAEATHQLVLKTDALSRSLAVVADEVDVAPVPTKQVVGTDYVIQEGTEGFGIDVTASIASISVALLASPPQHSVELPLVSIPAPVQEVGSAGAPSTSVGKEIVVVLSEQRIYAWEGGTLANTSLVSTGLPGYDTPVGTFKTFNHIKDHTMSGPGYYLPHVPNSMYFVGLIALHGAYWHNDFGQVKSHGCVNLPLDFAEWLFNWTPLGTTVRVVP